MKNDNNSHGNDSKKTPKSISARAAASAATDPEPRQGLYKSWQWTSTELKRALDHWDVLASETQGPSPDEKMLQDMQKLLVDLKVKLDSLSK